MCSTVCVIHKNSLLHTLKADTPAVGYLKQSSVHTEFSRYPLRTVNYHATPDKQYLASRYWVPSFYWRNSPHWAIASSFARRSNTTHHSQSYSSGQMTSQSHRPLPDNTQHSQQTDIYAPGGIRTHNLSKRAATDLRLRPRGHWDRHCVPSGTLMLFIKIN